LQFYRGSGFPQRYRGGLFVALHGSLFRDPLPRTGYGVVFIPFETGAPIGPVEPFAAGRRRLGGSLGTALIRPSGLAVDSSGALYISDDTGERIWRVTWKGG
jgi:glucose/arabinose dehydrogenase